MEQPIWTRAMKGTGKRGGSTAEIAFSKEERAAMAVKIQDYFRDELDQEIGLIPAEMFIAFLADEIGPYFYNRGLRDAEALLLKKIEDYSDEIYGLERREARTR